MSEEYMESEVKMKPTIWLSSEDLPQVESWSVGNKYKVLVELKQVKKIQDDDEPTRGCFEIDKITELPKKKFSTDDVKIAIDMDKLQNLT